MTSVGFGCVCLCWRCWSRNLEAVDTFEDDFLEPESETDNADSETEDEITPLSLREAFNPHLFMPSYNRLLRQQKKNSWNQIKINFTKKKILEYLYFLWKLSKISWNCIFDRFKKFFQYIEKIDFWPFLKLQKKWILVKKKFWILTKFHFLQFH